MLQAIILDCDGVIADTEPLHFSTFQKVLAEEQIVLTSEEYYRDYLALDDRECFTKVFDSHGIKLDPKKLENLIRHKAEVVEPVIRSQLKIFPGVKDFIRAAARYYPLAVASGALRQEVELVTTQVGVRDCFEALVCAEDVSKSKPDPEPFLMAYSALRTARRQDLKAAECLVIEDSIHGIDGARRAGMKCLAVTNSYPREKLSAADLVIDTLAGLELSVLESLF